MTGQKPRRTRSRVVAAVLTAAAGVGGGTWALWHDHLDVSGTLTTATASLAVGSAGGAMTTSQSAGASVRWQIPQQFVNDLFNKGVAAAPIEVDARAEGSSGLQYTVVLPQGAAGTVVGSSTFRAAKVSSPSACTTSVAAGPLTSQVLAAGLSAPDAATEYWCLVGTAGPMPGSGTYTNTGSVSATNPYDTRSSATPLKASSSWTATVKSNTDPALEPAAYTTFTWSTTS